MQKKIKPSTIIVAILVFSLFNASVLFGALYLKGSKRNYVQWRVLFARDI